MGGKDRVCNIIKGRR